MKPIYSFSEMITFIKNAETSEEVRLIFDVYIEEQHLYSAFHALLINYALNIAYYLLQVAEQTKAP